MWTEVVTQAGLEVAPVNVDHVELRSDRDRVTFAIRVLNRPPAPSQVPPAPPGRALLAVPRVSEAALAVATAAGWSVVAEDGTVAIRLSRNRWVRRRPSVPTRVGVNRSRGP